MCRDYLFREVKNEQVVKVGPVDLLPCSLAHCYSPLHVFSCCSLNDLSQFIEVTSKGFSTEMEDVSYEDLVEVMIHLSAVKDRQPTTDVMFEPLKHTIELLASYDQEMPEEVHRLLEVKYTYVAVTLYYSK